MPDGFAERTRQRGEAAVGGDRTPATRELCSYKGGDVPVPEVVELDLPQSRDEVVDDIVAVADRSRRLQGHGLGLEPGSQVVGDRLVGVGEEAAGAVDHPAQSLCGRVPDGAGEIDGERPGPVIRVVEESWAA